MTMQEYTGTILFVHLDTGIIERKPYPAQLRQNYLGGRGIGVKLGSTMIDPGVDPFDGKNVLIAATGMFTGSGFPLGARYDLVTKSPLTGTLSSANSGGKFGKELKRAGIDALVLMGAAATPVYLWISRDQVELADAAPYWGMTTDECTRSLQKDLRESMAKIACIGPAGEYLCRYAAVINDTSRAAGRGGAGAVMGAKRLKAVVVRGDRDVQERSSTVPEAREMARTLIDASGINRGSLHRYGTSSLVNLVNEAHLLPTRNFQESYFANADRISGEEMARTILTGKKACYSCSVACGRVTEVMGKKREGPEYETIWAFGPNCGIDNLHTIAQANILCNDLGLDTISTGATIACAMEMSERGYLKEEIRFGEEERILSLIERIAYRKGIGNELAEGSYRFSLCHGHSELSMSVKKQEIPAYDPRGLQGQGLEYATSVRGACHVYGNMAYPELLGIPVRLDPSSLQGKAYWVKHFQDLSAVIDSLGVCLFTLRVFSSVQFAHLVSLATGYPLSEIELLHIGERIWNLQRIFNQKAGYTRADDTLPERLMHPKTGWHREPLLSEYYALRGWDERGHPTSEKLQDLEIFTR